MKINKLQILLFFISAILSFSSIAQQNENTETFLGIGSGNRKIAKIQKTPIFPIHTDSVTILDDVKYYLEPKRYMTNYSIDNIKPARLKITANGDKLYRGYLKAGAGTYLTPLLELNYASKRSRDESWGLNSRTNGSFSSIKEMGNTKFSDLNFGGYYQKFFMNYDFWSEVQYERNSYQFYGLDYNDNSMYQFYGIDITDSLGIESFKNSDTLFKQNYDLLDLHVKFNSRNTGRDTNKLRIKSWVDFHHLNSNYNLSENHFIIKSKYPYFLYSQIYLYIM